MACLYNRLCYNLQGCLERAMSYLEFMEVGTSDSGKTKIWNVETLVCRSLGTIKWSGPWRKYVFRTIENCEFDGGCLREITEFCEGKTKEHKA
jgi:hypothetical protein